MNGRPIAVPLILWLNILVYVAWTVTGGSEPNFMTENFLVSWQSLIEGRLWTLVTSVFSHAMFLHLFVNMYVFWGFGSALEIALGTGRFVRFYLLAGVAASLCHGVVSAFLMGEPQTPALGASGAISGVVVVFSLLFPWEKIYLLGLIPLPAIGGAVLAVVLDLWGLISQTRGSDLPIGYGAHLGGALAGGVYYLFLRSFRVSSDSDGTAFPPRGIQS